MPPEETAPLEDEILGKAFDRRLMRRLLRYGLPYRTRMTQAVLLILATTTLSLAGPIVVQRAIDGPLHASIHGVSDPTAETPSPLPELLLHGAAFLAVSLLLIALRFFSTYNMARIGQHVMYDLRVELFSHLQRLPLAFYDANPVGRLVTRISSDVEALNEWFASGFVTLLADIMVLAGITTVLFLYDFELALITVAVLPLLLIATAIFRNAARSSYREQRRHLAHLGAFTQESVQGMSLIQLYHRQRRTQEGYERINTSLMQAFKKSVLAYSYYFPVVETLGKLTLMGILWYAHRGIRDETLTLGAFYLFWTLLERFFQPIRDMAERYNVLQSAMASAERLFRILDVDEALPQIPATARTPPPPDAPGHVKFKDVSFAYKDDEYVLQDVSFTVEPGQTVAIVGATGGGKSTIINLLSRFYDPQKGHIEMDGVDLRALDKQEVRRQVGVVLQDVFLFSRSVRENIRLGSENISDERVAECIRVVHADRFVERLEGSYDHVLTERGGSLSVGEKQLLAFARALAHDPRILVLDEATASVDTETEILIQEALERLFEDRTSIVIAHRLSTIRRADRILVVHKGRIRERGTHAELLDLGGIYSRLYELQYRGG